LERLSDKLEESEKDRVRRETELLSKINALEAKLSALSEQALHAAAKEAAREVFEKMVADRKLDSLSDQVQGGTKGLPNKID
jgi:preprotein translocase subunit SecA